MAKLSELEGVALGIVSRREPCTSYAVRKLLKDSPSSHWRGSAGSIYPLLERLEALRYIRTEVDPDDGRGRRLLQMTEAGRRVLANWILQGSSAEVAAGISDHIRTRFFFLAALRPADRLNFVNETANALREFLNTTERRLSEIDRGLDPCAWFASQNATMQARARVAWMEGVLEAAAAGELDGGDDPAVASRNREVAF